MPSAPFNMLSSQMDEGQFERIDSNGFRMTESENKQSQMAYSIQ